LDARKNLNSPDPTASMLADRLASIETSPTLALSAKAKALAKEGKSVVDLTAGEPDFPTPDFVKEAAIRAIQENHTRYTGVAGIPELRSAVAQRFNHSRQTAYHAEEVLVSCGAKHVLYNIFQALVQPGDEVIIFSPYWVSYTQMVYLAQAAPVIVETTEADGFLPDIERLKAAISPRTKLIVLNSPSNPTGAVIDRGRLAAIAELALRHDLWIISDEIYDELVYDPAKHVSIVQANPDIIKKTLLVAGVSKTYSMTGWRIGYAAGPKTVIAAMTDIQSHSTSNPTSISQYAALAALTGKQDCVAEMRRAFQARRDHLVAGLNALPGFRCPKPDGAFYAWCAVDQPGLSAMEIAKQWLERHHVAVVPSEGFGAEGWVRMSFATSIRMLDEALLRLKVWKDGLR
jgi:aspartate aminotransferase